MAPRERQGRKGNLPPTQGLKPAWTLRTSFPPSGWPSRSVQRCHVDPCWDGDSSAPVLGYAPPTATCRKGSSRWAYKTYQEQNLGPGSPEKPGLATHLQ